MHRRLLRKHPVRKSQAGRIVAHFPTQPELSEHKNSDLGLSIHSHTLLLASHMNLQ